MLVDDFLEVAKCSRAIAGWKRKDLAGLGLGELAADSDRALLTDLAEQVIADGKARRAEVRAATGASYLVAARPVRRKKRCIGLSMIWVPLDDTLPHAFDPVACITEPGAPHRLTVPAPPPTKASTPAPRPRRAVAPPQAVVVFDDDRRELASRCVRALEPVGWRVAAWPVLDLDKNVARMGRDTRLLFLGRSAYTKVLEGSTREVLAGLGVFLAVQQGRAAVWVDVDLDDVTARHALYRVAFDGMHEILGSAGDPSRVAGIGRGDPRFGHVLAGLLLDEADAARQRGKQLRSEPVREALYLYGLAILLRDGFLEFAGSDTEGDREDGARI